MTAVELLGTQMHIDAPVEDVFDFMADVENEKSWNPDLKSVRRVDGGDVRAGVEWDGVYRGMGRTHIRLEEYDRPRRLAFSTTGPRMNMRFSFDYRPGSAPGTTDITVDSDVEPRGFMRVMTPLLGPMMRKTFAQRPAQLAAGIRKHQDDVSR